MRLRLSFSSRLGIPSFCAKLKSRSRAQVLIMAAFGMVPLMAFTGIAIDVGYAQLRTRMLVSGVDAAVLAGTRTMVTGVPGTDFTDVTILAKMNEYLKKNATND